MPRESASSPGDGRGTKCPGSVGPYRPHRRPLCVRSAVRVRAKWEEQFHGCFASSQAGGGGEPGSGEVLPPPQRWVSASPPSSSREVASTRSSPHCRNWTFFILLFLKKRERGLFMVFVAVNRSAKDCGLRADCLSMSVARCRQLLFTSWSLLF